MMDRLLLPVLAGVLSLSCIGASDAFAQRGVREAPSQRGVRDDQMVAREQVDAGSVLPLRDIEKRVVPQMRGMQYLGPSYDSVAKAYRLRFMKNGKVVFVDVDARSGRVFSRSE